METLQRYPDETIAELAHILSFTELLEQARDGFADVIDGILPAIADTEAWHDHRQPIDDLCRTIAILLRKCMPEKGWKDPSKVRRFDDPGGEIHYVRERLEHITEPDTLETGCKPGKAYLALEPFSVYGQRLLHDNPGWKHLALKYAASNPELFREVLHFPMLRHLEGLSISNGGVMPEEVEALVRSPYLEQLRSLTIETGDDDLSQFIDKLTQREHPHVEDLSLYFGYKHTTEPHPTLTSDHVHELNEAFPVLKHLTMHNVSVYPETLTSLPNSWEELRQFSPDQFLWNEESEEWECESLPDGYHEQMQMTAETLVRERPHLSLDLLLLASLRGGAAIKRYGTPNVEKDKISCLSQEESFRYNKRKPAYI